MAYFIAGATAAVTLAELRGTVEGPGDLPGMQVATVRGSTAADYLSDEGMTPSEFDHIEEAAKALKESRVDAVVFDAPVLLHYASQKSKGRMKTVGLVFQKESYGIAVQTGSPYRETINQALLKLREDGTYQRIYNRWFGSGGSTK